MSVEKFEYVKGQDAKLDSLIQKYKELEASGQLQADERDDERDPKDPFGFGTEVKGSGAERAGEVVKRMMAFFVMCSDEYRLNPQERFFAAELFWLNVNNADDIPIPAVQIELARREAFAYYKSGVGG